MPSYTTNVSIANRALQKLGENPIEALTQNVPNARSMNTAFVKVRDALIRKYPWNFAITRASVAADASDTLWGEKNRYGLPDDFARLLRDDETGERKDWKIEGRYIVTDDASPLEFRYIALVTDPTLFDTAFVEAFSTALALATCKQITGNSNLVQELRDQLRDDLNDARNSNAFDLDAQESLEDDWLLAMR